jgi:DNA-binding FadR family transcriptional regulator
VKTVSAAVSQKLERRIYAGVYPVGAQLPSERALAVELGVNRNAVREALRVLEQQGLVQIRRGARPIVLDFRGGGGLETLTGVLRASPTEVTDAIFEDALDFRITYGMGIAELAAARIDQEGALKLQLALVVLRRADSSEAWIAAERVLLDGLVAASKNRIFLLLQNTLANAFKASPAFVALLLAHRRAITVAYGELVKRVVDGDPVAAGNVMRDLMENERRWAESAVRVTRAARSTKAKKARRVRRSPSSAR